MPIPVWRALLALAAVVAALALGACGGNDEDEGGGDTGGAPVAMPAHPPRARLLERDHHLPRASRT